MTLNTEVGVCGFFDDFGLRDAFQAQTAPKSLEINQNNLRTKVLAINLDFNGPSLNSLCSGGLCT